jgi:hypothetical protein
VYDLFGSKSAVRDLPWLKSFERMLTLEQGKTVVYASASDFLPRHSATTINFLISLGSNK